MVDEKKGKGHLEVVGLESSSGTLDGPFAPTGYCYRPTANAGPTASAGQKGQSLIRVDWINTISHRNILHCNSKMLYSTRQTRDPGSERQDPTGMPE